MYKPTMKRVCISVLACLLTALDSTKSHTDGWVKTPGIVHACQGDKVHLNWIYNETLGIPRGVNVARSDKVITLVSRTGAESPKVHRPRSAFLDNAGVSISNVTLEDAGKYESTVVFSAELSLLNEATLNVYSGCPSREDFQEPKLGIHLHAFMANKTELDINSLLTEFRILRLQVKVPHGHPDISCAIHIDEEQFDCLSGNASISEADLGRRNVTVTLTHIVFGRISKSITIHRSTVSTTTTVMAEEMEKVTEEMEKVTASDEIPEVRKLEGGQDACAHYGTLMVMLSLSVVQTVVLLWLFAHFKPRCVSKVFACNDITTFRMGAQVRKTPQTPTYSECNNALLPNGSTGKET